MQRTILNELPISPRIIRPQNLYVFRLSAELKMIYKKKNEEEEGDWLKLNNKRTE